MKISCICLISIIGFYSLAAADDIVNLNRIREILGFPSSQLIIGGYLEKERSAYRDNTLIGNQNNTSPPFAPDLIFKSQNAEVTKQAEGMDAIYQNVADYFQNPTFAGGWIVLDVASSVDSHATGVTNWTKIRVPLAKAKSSLHFDQTLRHETSHVFIEKMSNGNATTHFNAMRAFHEGVATAVELSVDDKATSEARLKMERRAALEDSRSEVLLELLCDDNELRKKVIIQVRNPRVGLRMRI